jgi:exonuclease III
VVGFKFNKDMSLKQVYVHFFNEDCGRDTRKNFADLQTKFPGKNVLPIDRIEVQYSLSKKGTGGNSNATAIQFPLRLAFASTAHKVQGLTVAKPNNLVVDLRTVRDPAQAYVILSRVQALSQLFILESVCADRITASMSAMDELKRMERDAINADPVRKSSIISCNIRSIRKNFDNFISASATKRAKVMCLQETWLDPSDSASHCNLLPENTGWKQHNNSVGKGKGISTFFTEEYELEKDITNPSYQMTKITSERLEIINVYRSIGAETENLLEDLCSLISPGKQTLLLGDFNLCFMSESFHQLFQALKGMGYKQIVEDPTSIKGRLIDLAFISPTDSDVFKKVQQQSQFFTDHDLIEIIEGEFNIFINPNNDDNILLIDCERS